MLYYNIKSLRLPTIVNKTSFLVGHKNSDINFRVYLNLDGGTCDVNYIDVIVGEEVELPSPTKDNYVFKGWYLDAELNNKVETYIPYTTRAIYAKWQNRVVVRYLDYIDSDGTAYIDTGVKLYQEGKWEFKCTLYSTQCRFLGNTIDSSHGIAIATPNTQLNWIPYCYCGTWNDNYNNTTTNFPRESEYVFLFKSGQLKFYINGVLHKSGTTYASTLYNGNIMIFVTETGSMCKHTRFSYCKLYIGDELVRDFRAALDDDDVPCMFDRVTKLYYYSAGSGLFTAGNIISTDDSIDVNKLEYIVGQGTLYIDTLLDISGKYQAELKASFEEEPLDDTWLMGDWGNSKCYLFGKYQGLRCRVGKDTSTYSADITFDTQPHIYKATTSNTYIDSTSSGISWSSLPVTRRKIVIGKSWHCNTSTTNRRIYYAKFWDLSNTLVMDLIPAKDSDNVVCMYDKVSKNYYYSTDGLFQAGPLL